MADPYTLRGIWERLYPLATAFAAGALWYVFGKHVIHLSEANKWHFDQTYTAVFGLLSITTGFLATFYGTIQSMSDGFIRMIKETSLMDRFLGFTKQAIKSGFLISILTIPMIVTTPLPFHRSDLGYLIVTIWIALATYAICQFVRVGSHMFLLFETKVPTWRPGG